MRSIIGDRENRLHLFKQDLRREVRGERFEEREERFLGAERSVIRSDTSRPGSWSEERCLVISDSWTAKNGSGV